MQRAQWTTLPSIRAEVQKEKLQLSWTTLEMQMQPCPNPTAPHFNPLESKHCLVDAC